MQFTPGTGNAVLKNTVASRRKFKDKVTDKYESDFISFVAFGKTAEFIANQFVKGQGILLETHMQSGSYVKEDGTKVYTLEAIVDNVEFLGSKGNNSNSAPTNNDVSEQENHEELERVDDLGDMPF